MDKKRLLVIGVILLSVAALLGSGFSAGYVLGQKIPHTILVSEVSNIETDKPPLVDFSIFWQAWKLITENYVEVDKVPAQDKVYGAIRGLVRSLEDPHSEFFTPSDASKFEEDIQGNFGGIGAEIGLRREQLIIIAPLKNTPAMQAGLRAGDKILKINASSTEGITVEQAVRAIRGPENTEVTLTILRDEWEKSQDIRITRGRIVVPTLDFEMKEENIAYVHLQGFNGNASRLFYDSMIQAFASGMKGLVLDLRDNPGGFLDVAVDLAGWFVPRGSVIVSEETRAGEARKFHAVGRASLLETPVVVIINQGSASASEILAGALRDLRGVTIVGDKSFGKGTIQQILLLKDGSSIKLTTAHWVLPKGQILEGSGLAPDVEVKLTDEDREAGDDPQLEKAIEILKTEMK